MTRRSIPIWITVAFLSLVLVGCGSSDSDSADTTQPDAAVDVTTTATDATMPDNAAESEGTELPDDWPDYLAVPDGFHVETSQSRTMSDGRHLSLVTAIGEGDPATVFGVYEDAVTAEGLQIGFQNDLNGVYQLTTADGDPSVDVTVEESPQQPGQTLVDMKYFTGTAD